MTKWINDLQAASLPSCTKLLEGLALFASNGREDLPLVRLYLATGLTLDGYVLKLELNKSNGTLAFYQTTPHLSLTYLDTQHINGIGFKDIQELSNKVCEQVLGFSKAFKIAPVSRLALERFVKEKNQVLNSSLGISIEILIVPDLPDELGLCKKYIVDVLQILEEIQQDELGKQATKEKLKSLSFDFSKEENHFTLKEQTLNLQIALSKFPEKEILKKVIEGLL